MNRKLRSDCEKYLTSGTDDKLATDLIEDLLVAIDELETKLEETDLQREHDVEAAEEECNYEVGLLNDEIVGLQEHINYLQEQINNE
jgi:hypothetical protein